MDSKLKAILKEIIEEYGLSHKTINPDNLELAGKKAQYSTMHYIYYYKMRRINKTIYLEYDINRRIAREVMVF